MASHLFTSTMNSSTVIPLWVASTISKMSLIESFSMASRFPDRTVLKGSRSLNTGLSSTTHQRDRGNTRIGHKPDARPSVPSWSNSATRSAGGTNFGLPCVVVACTNWMIACKAGPSFHRVRIHVDHLTPASDNVTDWAHFRGIVLFPSGA